MPTATLDLCPELPAVGDDLKITLPFGGELKAVRDFSQGIPNDCSMMFNLIVQLQPLLGGIGCILLMLDALSKMKEFVEAVVNNPLDIGSAAEGLLTALGKLAITCFPSPAMYASIACMIKDILVLVIKLLTCLKQFLESINNLNLTIDFDSAEGNPALLEVLDCAKSNAQLTMEHVIAALGPIESILGSLTPIVEFGQLSIEFPSLSEISPDTDLTETVAKIDEAIDALQVVADAIPC